MFFDGLRFGLGPFLWNSRQTCSCQSHCVFEFECHALLSQSAVSSRLPALVVTHCSVSPLCPFGDSEPRARSQCCVPLLTGRELEAKGFSSSVVWQLTSSESGAMGLSSFVVWRAYQLVLVRRLCGNECDDQLVPVRRLCVRNSVVLLLSLCIMPWALCSINVSCQKLVCIISWVL